MDVKTDDKLFEGELGVEHYETSTSTEVADTYVKPGKILPPTTHHHTYLGS